MRAYPIMVVACVALALAGCTREEMSPSPDTCARVQKERLEQIEKVARDAVNDIPENLSFMRQRFLRAIHDRPVAEEHGAGVGGGSDRYIERDTDIYDEAARVIKDDVRRLERALRSAGCQ